ncbi:erythromycin esterase family protein [Parasphingorhabdus sp.]|uniref:erythromycin esterase family protein n=1 Tax=Parasphingorhabdus sp. TaxID=2709688 RepID=UPI0032671CA9
MDYKFAVTNTQPARFTKRDCNQAKAKNVKYGLSNFRLAASCIVLALTGCGGGGGGSTPTPPPVSLPSPSPSPAPTPTPTPTPTPPATSSPDLTQNRLLSDAELETPEILPMPSANSDFRDWLAVNHQPIRSIVYDGDFSDLEFLSSLIGQRKIVQLGESSHGTAEFNHLKTRLIKYLHKDLGFSVVAFESGFFDGFWADSNINQFNPDQLMRFVFSVWHTNEVLELFKYVQETQSSANPLRLVGFDTQISSNYFDQIFPFIETIPVSNEFDSGQKSRLDKNLRDFRQMQTELSTSNCIGQRSNTCDDIIANSESIQIALDQDLAALPLNEQADFNKKILSIAIFAAIGQIENSRANYQTRDTGNVRDKNMAEIFNKLRTHVYPNEKIVIWAHNRHVANEQSLTVPVNSVRNYPEVPMGFHLRRDFPNDIYTIGFYMLRGTTAGNNASPVSVLAPKDNSLEAIAYSLRKAAFFVNSSVDQSQMIGNKFLFDRIEAHYWGGTFGSYTMVPSDQYDGIIFIDNSSTPAYR